MEPPIGGNFCLDAEMFINHFTMFTLKYNIIYALESILIGQIYIFSLIKSAVLRLI